MAAFRAAAASQGCMNNLTFGNDRFGYYETIAGGAGNTTYYLTVITDPTKKISKFVGSNGDNGNNGNDKNNRGWSYLAWSQRGSHSHDEHENY